MAPSCAHCGCKIVGHGVEAGGKMYCCAHCAQHHPRPRRLTKSPSPAPREREGPVAQQWEGEGVCHLKNPHPHRGRRIIRQSTTRRPMAGCTRPTAYVFGDIFFARSAQSNHRGTEDTEVTSHEDLRVSVSPW
jgi:hypothetical protein